MNKRHPIICIFLCFVLFFISFTPIVSASTVTLDTSSMSGSGIIESVGQNNEIIRIYNTDQRNQRSITFQSSNSKNEVQNLLISLGMSEYHVGKLSNEDLLNIFNSSSVTSITSYVKYGSDNTMVYLDEETALAEVEAYKSAGNIAQFNSNGAEINEIGESYMRLNYTYTYDGNAKYSFYLEAEWLLMPIWRAWDSLGACSMGLTVTPESREGSYSYMERVYVNSALLDETLIEESISSDNMYNVVDGSWYGSACTFDLPGNSVDGSVIYGDFIVIYEFSGHVHDPDTRKWFNTVGTYDHSYIGLSIDPTVGISYDGATSASIGLDLGIVGGTQKCSIEYEVLYIPDEE